MENITQNKMHEIVGKLLAFDKYKFLPTGLVGEIIRDFVKEYNKETEPNSDQLYEEQKEQELEGQQ